MVDSQDALLQEKRGSLNNERLSQPIKQTSAQIALWLSLLTLLGVLALGYYLYMMQQKWAKLETQSQQSTQTVQSLLAEAKTDIEKVNALHQQNAKEQQSFETLTKDIENVQTKLSSLSQDPDWVIISLNSLATSANERLQVAHDLPSALFQLKIMNEKLSTVEDPNFKPLKEAITKDIATLQSFPISQRQATWDELSHFSEKFNQLTFKKLDLSSDNTQIEPVKPEKPWQKALWGTWQELKSLVKVTREDTSNIPLTLSFQEKGQILRAMQLMTEQAQWAVLNAQVVVYQKSLENLKNILRDYFAADLHQTSFIEEITKLQQRNIAWENTNITQTQEALSHLMKKFNANKTLQLPSRENP